MHVIRVGRHMIIACWVTKARTHSDYIILIAFPLQHLLQERARILVIRSLRVFHF